MSKTSYCSNLASSFEAHDLDGSNFGHLQHLQVAYELLHKYDFTDATAKYVRGIQAVSRNAGLPDKFNATVTYAFLSLIAERMMQSRCRTFSVFLDQNSDLLSSSVLEKWYAPERLNSQTARTILLLPQANI